MTPREPYERAGRGQAWRGRSLQLVDALILALCHLPHELLGTGSSGVGSEYRDRLRGWEVSGACV